MCKFTHLSDLQLGTFNTEQPVHMRLYIKTLTHHYYTIVLHAS